MIKTVLITRWKSVISACGMRQILLQRSPYINQPTRNTMAIAVPHQPRYRDRRLPIYYLVDGQMRLRRRPTRVHDPRSPGQLRQRLRMRVASHFLAPFRPMLEDCFEPELKENFRRVGSYQCALGHMMRSALVDTEGGVSVALPRLQLSAGDYSPLRSVTASARGGVLRVGWQGQLPRRCARVWVAVWNRARGRALCRCVPCEQVQAGLSLPLPGGWEADALDVWVAPRAEGEKGRFDSLYAHVRPLGTPTVLTVDYASATFADLRHRLSERCCPEYGPNARRIRVVDIYSGRRLERGT